MEEVKRILTILEDIIRGRCYEEANVVIQCKEIFAWGSNLNVDGLMSSETKTDIFKNGISIHNKLRVLPSNLFEAKAYLKGFSAWLLLKFGDLKPNSAALYVKVFLRASQELVSYDQNGIEAGLLCINQAISSWNEVGPTVFERCLNPIEFSELKSLIVTSFLEKLKILSSLKCGDYISDMKQSISGALELIHSMPFAIKINFTKTAANIGHQFSKQLKYEESTFYFSMGLTNLDSISKTEFIENVKNQAFNIANLIWMKIRLNLCLTYVLQEQNLCEKAMECVRIAENLSLDPQVTNKISNEKVFLSSEKLKNAFLYAKFSINKKAGDWEAAETNLKAMIELADSNTIEDLISSIESLNESFIKQEHIDILDLYDKLLDKFKDDCNITRIRISLLKSMILNEKDTSNLESHNSFSVCKMIIVDHLNSKNTLDKNSIKTFKNIMNQRITWLKVNQFYQEVILWCDTYIKLISSEKISSSPNFVAVGEGWYWGESGTDSWIDNKTDLQNDHLLVMLRKAEAHFALKEFNKAFETSIEAVNILRCTKSLAIVFMCSLNIFDGDLEKIMLLLDQMLSPFKSLEESKIENVVRKSLHLLDLNTIDRFTREFKLDTLDRILICDHILSEVKNQMKSVNFYHDLRDRILNKWIKLFSDWEIWRYQDIDLIQQREYLDKDFTDDGQLSPNYLNVFSLIFENYRSQFVMSENKNHPEINVRLFI
jgi:hypothetical protein